MSALGDADIPDRSDAGAGGKGAAEGAGTNRPTLGQPEGTGSQRNRNIILALVLAAVCFMMRRPGLMDLPIFGDESIYLRWAQLVRGEGVELAYPWVSLADPKPPFHFWLIAWVFNWTADPLLAARLISVAAGVAGIPLFLAIGSELDDFIAMRKVPSQVTGHALGLIAAILAIFCPFLAFYQRLATADALFTCESLLIVWLSLRWARLAVHQGAARDWAAWRTAIFLGLALGAGLMTRQGVSYTIFAMPIIAWFMHRWIFNRQRRLYSTREQVSTRPRWGRGFFQFSTVCLIAAAVWMPYLTADLHNQAMAHQHEVPDEPYKEVGTADLMKEVKRRIFYQETITGGHGQVAAHNALLTFIPQWNKDGQPTSGWFYLYLTPTIYGACLVGMLYLAARQRMIFALLLFWALLMLAPVILLANSIYSRYVLAGVPPLLFAGAFWLAEVTALLINRSSRRNLGWLAAAALWLAVILWPMKELGTQATRWWNQELTARDRYQYITGWTAGYATRQAIVHLRVLAHLGPIVVITDNGWGTPADALWVYLSQSREPNIRIYFTDNQKLLVPANEIGTYRLKDDKWLFPKERAVRLPQDGSTPVLYVTGATMHPDGKPDTQSADILRAANPNLAAPETFKGIAIDGRVEGEGVDIFPLRPTPDDRPRRGR